MRIRNRLLSWLLIFAMAVTTFVLPVAEAQAVVLDGGYDTDDPKGFYNLMTTNKKDAIFQNNSIYFATKYHLASASTGTRYQSIGYTIDVTNGTDSLQIEIAKPGNAYTDVKSMTEGDIGYSVNAISYTNIVKLCKAKYGANNAAVKNIFSSSRVKITCNAIMCVKLNGTPQGGVTENSNGTVTPWGTIYRLANTTDYNNFMNYGWSSKNAFSSYMNIQATVPNETLTVNYYADTKTISNANNYGSVSNGTFTSSSAPTSTAATSSTYKIATTGQISGASVSGRQLESITIQTLDGLGLEKKGYYLTAKEAWKDDNGNIFEAGKEYYTTDINWTVTSQNTTTNLYANWKPITYTLKYDGNGGSGSMPTETHTFDEEFFRIKEPAFTRKGHTFTGWKLYDSSGNVVTLTDAMIKSNTSSSLFSKALSELGVNAYVRNLTSANGEELTLKAQWTPNEYLFTLNAQPPAGKTITNYTTEFLSLFANKFSLTSGGSAISKVTVPSITGYKFLGYFENTNSTTASVTSTGVINFSSRLYDQNKTFLGRWEPVQVTLTLDADTESTGADATPATQSLTATYDSDMPEATLPSKPGYTFKGFYTAQNGKGTQYYNASMISQRKSTFTSATTLYAYWVDENNPSATIQMESSTWTNSGDNRDVNVDSEGNFTGDDVYNVTITASDVASGIDEVYVFRADEEDVLQLLPAAFRKEMGIVLGVVS